MQQHAHDHSQHGHVHGHAHFDQNTDRRRLLAAMLLTAGFMFAEVIGGLIAGSLALIADAAHMLTDAVSLGVAWVAFRLTDLPADGRRTYGFHRFPVLAAFVNGLTLLLICGWIGWEAIHRLLEPRPVMGGTMAVIAAIGLLVNVVAFAILNGGSRENLNMRGAALHVVGDLLGSVAALTAAGVILLTGWTPIDPLLSLLIAVIVLRSAWYLLHETTHVLLEGSPAHIDPAEVKRSLENEIDGVHDVHHVHTWSLSPERPMLSLHVQTTGAVAHDRLVARIKDFLSSRFGVHHSTLQVEYDDQCVDHAAESKDDQESDDVADADQRRS